MRKLIGSAALLALAALFYPVDTVDIPEWKTLHVDQWDRPIKSMKVQQRWHNSTLEGYSVDHRADTFTDQYGIAVFPEHHIAAPMILRIFGPVLNFLGTGIHASYGPSSQIDSYCDVSEVGATRATYDGRGLQYKTIYYYFKSDLIGRPGPRPPTECDYIEKQVKEAAGPK